MVGLVIAAPTGLAPAPAAALSREPELAQPASKARGGPAAGKLVEEHDALEVVAEPELTPSIHYQHALEHAGDAIDFEPGERVTVPFTPRADDDADVDGRAPRALPAGHATGMQMREAAAGSDWSAGLPRDVAEPAHFAESREARDEAARERLGIKRRSVQGARVESGGIQLASAAVDPAGDDVAAAPIGRGGLRREIFGFLPYWELSDRSTVVDWRTLSTLAYFSVGCTGSGNLQRRNPDGSTTIGWSGWTSSKMTSIINAAHRNRSRVVLTISCFAWSSGGAATQASLLRSAASRSRLAKQAAAAVRDRGADGINLDFEPLVAGYADEFTALVRAVRRELNAIAPGYQLTFDTLGAVGNQPIAAATAPGGADAVFVMAYDYRTAGAAVAGSISPLSGPAYDLTDTVKAYTAKISPSKVILGVPYYGRAWSTSTGSLHGRNISGDKYGGTAEPTYAQAVDLVAAYGRRYDSVEQAPWTAYRKRTCTARHGCVTGWRQLYYDDAASLRLRYDLVNRANLRGVGIWALGYDDARPELRGALSDKFLADKFRADSTPPRVGVTTLAQQQRDEGFRVGWSSYDDSPVARYDVQASVDGRPWAKWLTGTTLTSSIFLGTNGRTYAFRARATDAQGNVSSWRSLALRGLGAPGSITVGGFATVLADGLRVRDATSNGARIRATLRDGAAVQVTGGPVSRGGYIWYRVAGPVRQWTSVATMRVGGWVAAFGQGVKNLAPRAAVYATRVNADLAGFRLGGGGVRVLTPNGDGSNDTLRIDWTNRRAFKSVSLRVHRVGGTLAGTVVLGAGKTRAGPQSYQWDGRLGGRRVRPGAYVIQLRGVAGSATFNAPSVSPVSAPQIARFGVMVGPTAPTSVVSFTTSPASPTQARTIRYTIRFGGPVRGLSRGDIVRVGTAPGCKLGAPTGSGATWSIVVSGCGTGTVVLSLKAGTVVDGVSNWGPTRRVTARRLIIDRTPPSSGAPKASLPSGVALASASTGTGVLVRLTWRASDAGRAGLASYDVAQSRDGGPFSVIASGLMSRSLAVPLPPGHTYRFKVRARDRAGNIGAWRAGPTFRPWLVQQAHPAINYRGAWRLGVGARFSGGTDQFSISAGATAKLTFRGRGIAWVTARGPDRGVVKVYVDGVLVARIDTHAAKLGFRSVAYSRTWAAIGTHTIKLVVAGTDGHPRLDLDAFELLR